MTKNQIEAGIMARLHREAMAGFEADANPLNKQAEQWAREWKSQSQFNAISGRAIELLAWLLMTYAIFLLIADGLSGPTGYHDARETLWVGLTMAFGWSFWPVAY